MDTLNNRILLKLFLFCMKYNECPSPAVRFRCTQIIHKLLEGIGDNGAIPDDLYRSLQDILLRRVQDVKSVVRVQAVQALARMQDPTLADCPAVEAFVWLTRHDPTVEVRRAALAAMVLTTKTLPVIIERCRDVSDSVRRTAYKILAARSVLRPLSIARRIRILQDGLTDRSVEVKQAAQELVLSWFRATDKDPIHLLRRLDTEGVPETSQLLLGNLFTVLPVAEFQTMIKNWIATYLNEERILKPDMYSAEAAFFWRALAEFLYNRRTDGSSLPINSEVGQQDPVIAEDAEVDTDQESNAISIESILPSVSTYVDMIKRLVDRLIQQVIAHEFDEKAMERECVVEQVLRLADYIDLSDEFGRRKLGALIHDWITSPVVTNTLSPHLLRVHGLLEPNLRKRINGVIEMISELCDPVDVPAASTNTTCTQPIMDGGASCSLPPVTLLPDEQKSPAAISKDEERALRLKIAKLEVRMNELNESLHNCVLRKDFEKATDLRDECAQLEAERSALLHKLRGTNVALMPAPVPPGAAGDSIADIKSDTPENRISSEDEKEADDEPHGLLDRCSASVLLKANRLASLIIQQSPTLWRLPASLRSLLDSLVFPSIQHEDPSVRNQAILTLGLCCSMDLPLALQYLPLFYSAMRVDHVMISETALKCIVDCLVIFGFRPFHDNKVHPNTRITPMDEGTEMSGETEEEESDVSDASAYVVLNRHTEPGANGSTTTMTTLTRREEMSKTAARLLKPIVALLDGEDDDLRATSALGLAKLLIYDRFVSGLVLSKLVLLWFNPLTEDRPAIRRGLACFFTDYACGTLSSDGSSVHFEHQCALADAVLPTLTALIRAPASSPLSEIEAADVAALLAHLTDKTLLTAKEDVAAVSAGSLNRDGPGEPQNPTTGSDTFKDNPHHDKLALQLSTEILKAPQSAEARLYLRMLCHLRPSMSNVKVHTELFLLSEAMLKYSDRSTTLLLHRFRKIVNQNLERLHLDPHTLLAEAKRSAEAATSSISVIVEHCRHSSSSGEGDSTLLASCHKTLDPDHPTLLGSARVNMHLLTSNAHPSHSVGPSQLHANQSSRAAMGLSLLDKSLRPTHVLRFSESEDSDQDESCEPVAGSRRLSTRSFSASKSKKSNIRVCSPSLSTADFQEAEIDSHETDVESKTEEENKENSAVQRTRRKHKTKAIR
ncbi:unnamed protein product [Dicrocoelium dendriticum]|nr:unnamed protein product [Dicrocoelium dendriticum]